MKQYPQLLLFVLTCLWVGCGEKDTRDPLLIKADSGDASAQVEWAKRLQDEGKLNESVGWYEKAATQGNVSANETLMQLLSRGDLGDERIKEGLDLAGKLATDGNSEAKVILARALLDGRQIAKDEARAQAMISELIEEEHPYGSFWEASRELETGKDTLSFSDRYDLERKVEKAATAGIMEAQFAMGQIFEAKEDGPESDKWYLQAADQGHVIAAYKVGLAYQRLGNHPRYAPLSFTYLSKAEAAGVEEAIFPLAQAYMNSMGISKDEDEALDLLLSGASLGQFDCVDYLLRRSYLMKDWDRSRQTSVAALLTMADGLDDKMVKAINARLDSADTMFRREVDFAIEQMVLRGRQYRFAHDPSLEPLTDEELRIMEGLYADRYGEHKAIYISATEEEDSDSMLQLAKLCLSSEESIFDPEEAIYWINLASEVGDSGASWWAYDAYAKGELSGITAEQAMKFLKDASMTENGRAKLIYAKELISGEHVEVDYFEALGLLDAANELGESSARDLAKELIQEEKGIYIDRSKRINGLMSGGLVTFHDSVPSSFNVRLVKREQKQLAVSKWGWGIIEELAEEGSPIFRFLLAEDQIRDFEREERFSTRLNASVMSGAIAAKVKAGNGYIKIPYSSKSRDYREKTGEKTKLDGLDKALADRVKDVYALAEEGYAPAQFKAAGWKLYGYYGDEDDEGAIELIKNMAASDEASLDAKFLWGYAMFTGFHCQKDVVAGTTLIREAAENGNEAARPFFKDFKKDKSTTSFLEQVYEAATLRDPESMISLAWHYRNNEDYEEEEADKQYLRWISEAAKEGSVDALKIIYASYMKGDKVEKNPLRAIRFLEQAANAGDAQAQYDVGCHYAIGDDITEDFEKAEKYIRMAAEQDHQQALILVTSLDSMNEESGVKGPAFRNAVISSALKIDFFPIRPMVLKDGEIYPVVGSKSRYPSYSTNRGVRTAKKKDKTLFFADGSFGEGKIEIPHVEYTAPIIRMDNGWVYTGNYPAVKVTAKSDTLMQDAYMLLVLKDYEDNIKFHWRPIGSLKPGKEVEKTVRLDDEDLFFDGEDIAIYFFSQGKEIVTEHRVQLHYFLDKNVTAFTEKRNEYLEGKSESDLPPKLFQPIPYAKFGDLKYNPGFNVKFAISELGFISDLTLPNELKEDVKDRLYQVLGDVRFYPKVEEGIPKESRALIAIQ